MMFHHVYTLCISVPMSIVVALNMTIGNRVFVQEPLIATLTSGDPGDADNDDAVGGPRPAFEGSAPLDGQNLSEGSSNDYSEVGLNASRATSPWNAWADSFAPRCRWSEEFEQRTTSQPKRRKTPGQDCAIPEPKEMWDPWRGGESQPSKLYTKLQRCPLYADPLLDSSQASSPRRMFLKEKDTPRGPARWPESPLCSPEDLSLYVRHTQRLSPTQSLPGKSAGKQQPKFVPLLNYSDLANTTTDDQESKQKSELHPLVDFIVVLILSWFAYSVGYEYKVDESERLERERSDPKSPDKAARSEGLMRSSLSAITAFVNVSLHSFLYYTLKFHSVVVWKWRNDIKKKWKGCCSGRAKAGRGSYLGWIKAFTSYCAVQSLRFSLIVFQRILKSVK